MNTPITLALVIAAFGLYACEPERRATDLPPGTYEKTVSKTDANGTTYKTEDTTEVSEDADGDKTAVVKSKTTTDPRGLFNKSTSSKTTVVREDNY
jgi:hypothetical protein